MPRDTMPSHRGHTPAVKFHAVTLLSSLLALWGTYWDDAWHTDIGRDTFWSPPHLFLFGGVAIAGIGVALHALQELRSPRRFRAILANRGLLLSLVGAGATLASAPIDEVWHALYGRDAVAWSPPHMLGLVGVLLLVGGVQLSLRHARGPPVGPLRVLASAALLAVLLAAVFEYDSDVPQFDEMWYLPVLVVGLALAFPLAARSAPARYAATEAATLYTGLIVVTILLLGGLGHSAPIVPAVLLPALAYDVVRQRVRAWPIHALTIVVVTFLTYVPYLNLLLDGVRLDAADIAIGFALALVGSIGAVAAVAYTRGGNSVRAAFAVGTTLLVAASASAHDPGQGTPVADVRLTAFADQGAWHVEADVESEKCESFAPVRAVARRAGQEVEAPLERDNACHFEATLMLSTPGRWFVYVEFRDGDGRSLEAWMPLESGERHTQSRETQLYVPPAQGSAPAQVAAGAVLYVLEAVMVGALLWAHRRAPPAVAAQAPGASARP